jgi:hypothetical protein
MLRRIQERLHALYDLDVPQSVDDFMCGPDVARAATADATDRGEVLVVLEDPTDVRVGLYVDPGAIAALGKSHTWWRSRRTIQAFCLATEGVSHFVYLMFRAARQEGVSQLELEIQAEVDKYATGLLDAKRSGPLLPRSLWLRRRLFHGVTFRDSAHTEAGQRYRLATRTAARYVSALESTYVARGDLTGLARELRRFYRRGSHGKLRSA